MLENDSSPLDGQQEKTRAHPMLFVNEHLQESPQVFIVNALQKALSPLESAITKKQGGGRGAF